MFIWPILESCIALQNPPPQKKKSLALLERVPVGAALPFVSPGLHKIHKLPVEDPNAVSLEKCHPGRTTLTAFT